MTKIFNNKDSAFDYITKLLIFCNNYFVYDINYIIKNYKINSYSEFRKFFKNNYKIKLIFNSSKSEKLFINFMNIDYNYIYYTYKFKQCEIFINFFIVKRFFYLNKCYQKKYSLNNKNYHCNNCLCKIKVKSIVNLKIDTLIFIILQFEKEKNLEKYYKFNKFNNNNELKSFTNLK